MTDTPEGTSDSGPAAGETAPVPEKPAGPGRSGRWMAALALLLSLAAVAGTGALWLLSLRQYQSLSAEATAPDPDVSALRDQQMKTAASVQALQNQAGGTERALVRLREELADIPDRLHRLDDAVAQLRGGSTDMREQWLRSEAEYLLGIANSQLQLAHDWPTTIRALELADERLRQLGRPELRPVRDQIAAELQALESVETPDIDGIALRIGNLISVVPELPYRQPVQENFAADAPAEPPSQGPGLERALASVKRALNGLLSIHRSEQSGAAPELAPKERYFVRRNLELQLETARLAALRRQTSVYKQSLSMADDWLSEYFDDTDPAVRNARIVVENLALAVVAPKAPDISGSLRALRQVRLTDEAPPQ